MQIAKKVAEAARHLRRAGIELPTRAVLLEERMRGFSNELQGLTVVQQRRVPGFPLTLPSDPGGRLLFGRLAGVPTAVAEGRSRLLEGHLPGECGVCVRLFVELGARSIVLVADGLPLRDDLEPGTMLLLRDRIDLAGVAHLKGVLDAPGGPLIEVPATPPEAFEAAREAGSFAAVPVAEGVAALVHGPLLPTPAEQRLLRLFGADACSTALGPELAAVAYTRVRAAAFLLIGGSWDRSHLEFLMAFLERFAPDRQ